MEVAFVRGVEIEETWLLLSAVFCLMKAGVAGVAASGLIGPSKSHGTPCF